MNKLLSMALISGVSALLLTGMASNDKVIYGEDDRIDAYKVQDRAVYDLTQSTVALIPKGKLSAERNGLMEVSTGTLSSSFGVCSDEPFANQPNPANCSGFLVGEDLVATAGHCVNASSCENYAYVFSYQMRTGGEAPTSVPANDVYNCKEVIAHGLTSREDFALIRLSRPVVGRTPLKVRTSGKPSVGDELMVIGHPSGLPTKVAPGAILRSIQSDNTYFTASLDTYGGNSGSAVFNSRTLEVEGILVRGERDYVYDYQNSCRRSNFCTMDGCRGEDVTSIHYIADQL